MTTRRQALGAALATIGGLHAHAAWADGSGGGGGDSSGTEPDPHEDPVYLQAVAAINEQRWPDAIRLMRWHVLQYDRDADGHNWLAYSYRKAGRLDDAFKHYKRALGIDRAHLGAHEYIGEAYLQARQPDEAEKHLQRLAELCSRDCEQYRDLERAIAQYRRSASVQ